MSQSTAHKVKMEQLESELVEIFLQAPTGLAGHTHLAVPARPRAFNAVQHGLSGQNIILCTDEILPYAQMGLDFMRDLQPVGALEIGNAQLYFEDRWRLHRILKIENDLFCIDRPSENHDVTVVRKSDAARQVNAFREEARNIDLISRYETRLVRNSGRMMDEIRKLRGERSQANPDLIYDEQTNPAVDWYRRLLAQAERITQATKQFEAYEAAAAKSEQTKSTTSNRISFGKNPPAKPPINDQNPKPSRNLHDSRIKNAA